MLPRSAAHCDYHELSVITHHGCTAVGVMVWEGDGMFVRLRLMATVLKWSSERKSTNVWGLLPFLTRNVRGGHPPKLARCNPQHPATNFMATPAAYI